MAGSPLARFFPFVCIISLGYPSQSQRRLAMQHRPDIVSFDMASHPKTVLSGQAVSVEIDATLNPKVATLTERRKVPPFAVPFIAIKMMDGKHGPVRSIFIVSYSTTLAAPAGKRLDLNRHQRPVRRIIALQSTFLFNDTSELLILHFALLNSLYLGQSQRLRQFLNSKQPSQESGKLL